jgi:iron-sulfur cluster assembly protein
LIKWDAEAIVNEVNDLIEFSTDIRQGNEKLVKVTLSASQKLTQLMDREGRGNFLRIRITGGGCNGLSYKMKFVEQGKSGDIGVLSEGIRVLVDSKTALYLRGTTLEFSDKLVGGGFKFSNPNAKASCSCGESFNL